MHFMYRIELCFLRACVYVSVCVWFLFLRTCFTSTKDRHFKYRLKAGDYDANGSHLLLEYVNWITVFVLLFRFCVFMLHLLFHLYLWFNTFLTIKFKRLVFNEKKILIINHDQNIVQFCIQLFLFNYFSIVNFNSQYFIHSKAFSLGTNDSIA